MKHKKFNRSACYKILSVAVITILAIAFAFPLYWIVTGSFKTSAAINATTPQWWPQEWVLDNYQKLFSRQFAPLWEIHIPFTDIQFLGPDVPAAIRWLLNTVFMAVAAMLLTCITADDPCLRDRIARGLCAGKKAFSGTYPCLFSDCMRNGFAKTGYFDSVAA